jgi:hypothetical protein
VVPLRKIPLLFLAAALASASAARAELEFVGLLVAPQKSLFALSDPSTRQTRWVAVGQTFGGYTVTGFDAALNTLTLTQGVTSTRLRLIDDAKITAGRLEITGTIKLGHGEKMEVSRATLLFDQENVFPLQDGLVCRITPTRRPDGNILYRAAFDRTTADGKKETLAMPSVIDRPGDGFNVEVGDLGFSFTPKG